MIAADTVLKDITPNPVLSPDPLDSSKRFPSLGEYLVSLARIRAAAPTVVHGGHGGDVHDFESYFFMAVRFHDERQRKLASLLTQDGSTAWDACLRLFPRVKGAQRFLALSETIAHLDYAAYEGRVEMEQVGDVEVFTALRGVHFG
jgi:glyoxylase-like metal-dependent hydrolase (beta-lactamase superfamily II)